VNDTRIEGLEDIDPVYNISQADIYQMVSYAVGSGISDIGLIYPHLPFSPQSTKLPVYEVEDELSAGKVIRIHPVKVNIVHSDGLGLELNGKLTDIFKPTNDSLINELKRFEKLNNADSFYEIRGTFYSDKVSQAARFIYLNKTCFNGLWRVNSNGFFNVPFGRYKNPNILDADNLRLCSKRLQKSKISHGDYVKAVSKAARGDVVYFDPPYIPLTKTAAFSQYAKEDFGLGDQETLALTIKALTARGVRVILSNSDTPLTRKIFGRHLVLRQILVARTISAQASTRKSVYEVIGTNYRLTKDVDLQKLKIID
jgi:DNA adenine methylase